MRSRTVVVALLTLLMVYAVMGCDDTRHGVVLTNLPIKVPSPSDPSQCPAERPENTGCTTLCQPCTAWICKGGAWVRWEVAPPADLCTRPRPGSPPFSACPRTEAGVCPAECRICF
jgi:hypothetical protein